MPNQLPDYQQDSRDKRSQNQLLQTPLRCLFRRRELLWESLARFPNLWSEFFHRGRSRRLNLFRLRLKRLLKLRQGLFRLLCVSRQLPQLFLLHVREVAPSCQRFQWFRYRAEHIDLCLLQLNQCCQWPLRNGNVVRRLLCHVQISLCLSLQLGQWFLFWLWIHLPYNNWIKHKHIADNMLSFISMQKTTGRITAMPPPVRFPTAFYFRCWRIIQIFKRSFYVSTTTKPDIKQRKGSLINYSWKE